MSALAPLLALLKPILEVLLPFLWDKATEPEKIIVRERGKGDEKAADIMRRAASAGRL